MGLIIFIIFSFTAVLCFLEERLPVRDKKNLYALLAVLLILLAGFREVGVDPDSDNYDYAFHHCYDENIRGAMEYSYFFLSAVLGALVPDVHIVFLFYALLGVTLKFVAFRKMSDFWFVPVMLYLTFIFELHEVTQIRTGVMSGLFLLAIRPIAEKKRIKALILIGLGAVFHVSALALIPLVFFGNKEMSIRERMFWTLLIPCSYIAYFAGSNLMVDIPIAYIENKITNYEKTSDIVEASLNVFSPLHLFTISLYVYIMYFYDTIKEYNKYLSLMMKIFTLSIVAFTAFSFLPVLANRMSYLLRIVTIILFGNIYYTIRPRYVGLLVVILIALVYMAYTFSYIFGIKFY